jgi:hypothetical protein
MNQQNPHALVGYFDGLSGIRNAIWRYVKENPNELGGLFMNFFRN